jgi:Kdo2-lipid IVA lauroyltransferase/acyltransferase
VILTRHAHVGAVDRFWQRRRAVHGVEVVDSAGSLPQILRLLRAGRPVGLAIDQHEGGTSAVRVPFLGRDAGTTKTPALLAARTGCAVLPSWSWRDQGGLHHATFGPEIPLQEGATLDETIVLTTRAYNAWLEGVVREHPEQWLWVHRRWKPA